MAGTVNYIKVARIDGDGNDLTDTLQDLTKLTIPYSSGNVTYDVLNITRYSTYFMYYVENPSIDFADRDDIEYIFTGSLEYNEQSTSLPSIIPGITQLPITSSDNDPLNFYDSSFKRYSIKTYPQKDLHIILSGSYTYTTTSGRGFTCSLYTLPINSPIITYPSNKTLITQSYHPPGAGNFAGTKYNVPQSITPGTDLLLTINRNGSDIFFPITSSIPSTTKFYITSSTPLGTGLETIPEPYFTQNFSRAYDCQPLLNNVSRYNANPYLQDLDYQTSQTVPVNIQAVISESATKGTVPQSHYTQLSSTLIRYDGSKSTSQFLNKWTPGDTGGYGKLPNIDSTQVYVAYCDSITSSIQERMDTSAAHVKYLIKDDGTIIIPDVTPNSLGTIQDNFISQERLELNSQTVGTGGGSNSFREIIRGGSRIEPIIYNQKSNYIEGSMSFDSSIYLTDNNLVGGVIDDFQARLRGFTPIQEITNNIPTTIAFSELITSGSGLTPGVDVVDGSSFYKINSGVISEGVTLNFYIEIFGYFEKNTVGSGAPSGDPLANVPAGVIKIYLYNNSTSTQVGDAFYNDEDYLLFPDNTSQWNIFRISDTISVNPLDLTSGHEYVVKLEFLDSPTWNKFVISRFQNYGPYYGGRNSFWILQSPTPTSTIPTEGLFNKVPDAYTSSYQGIYVTASNFVSAYSTPNIQQSSSVDSGFIPITTNLEFIPGDEFRFMGQESKSFMIEKVELGLLPFTTTSASLMIYLDGRVNPDDTVLNVNQFLVRRYVDEASSIIFKGDKPLGSDGPYIVSPEFISSDLDKDVDTFITDLTERNVLP